MIELYDQMTSVLLAFSLELDMPEDERDIGFRLALSNYFERVKLLQLEKQQREEEEDPVGDLSQCLAEQLTVDS